MKKEQKHQSLDSVKKSLKIIIENDIREPVSKAWFAILENLMFLGDCAGFSKIGGVAMFSERTNVWSSDFGVLKL